MWQARSQTDNFMTTQTSQETPIHRSAGALLADFLKLSPDDMSSAWGGRYSVYRERYSLLPAHEKEQFDLRLCATVLTVACDALRAAQRCLDQNGDLNVVFNGLKHAVNLQRVFIGFSSPKANLSGAAARLLYENIEHDMIGKLAFVKHDIEDLSFTSPWESEKLNSLMNQIQFCLAVLTAQRALLFHEVQLQEIDPLFCLYLAASELPKIGDITINGEVEQNADPSQHVRLSIDTSGQQIYADPNVLTLALFNVIKNAVRANSDSKALHIEVAVTKSDDDLGTTITVRDNGIGLDYAKIRRALGNEVDTSSMTEVEVYRSLFTRGFSLAGKSTGLGLSIVRSLIEDQLSGEVSIANHPKGGAIVTILLPPKTSNNY